MRSGLAALTLLVMSAGSSGIAQLIGGPAEVPPATYTAREYVDSKGCAFQRASVSGTLLWLPRVTSDNQPVCNKAPTLGGSVPATALGTKIETPTVPASAKPGRTAPERVATVTTSAHVGAYGEVKLIEQQEVQQSATLCLSVDVVATRLWLSDGRRVTHCGGRIADPVAFLNGLGLPDLKLVGTDYSSAARLRARKLGSYGYEVTWASGPTRAQRPVPSINGDMFWLQVGAFAEMQNVDRAIGNIRKLDLPVARQKVRGGHLTAVLAGPFTDRNVALTALAALQLSGFHEAFLR